MSNAERPEYRVVLASKRVEKELDSLPDEEHRRAILALRSLARNPRGHGTVSIHGDIHRMRVSLLRIIYLIVESEREIVVGAIRRGSESTYRDVRRLF